MDHTECRITVFDCVYKNANCKQIVNLIDRLVLVDHFFIYSLLVPKVGHL